jgi:hypothetical protein
MAFGWVTREQYERLERDNDNLKAEVSELRAKLEAELRAQIGSRQLSEWEYQPSQPVLVAQSASQAQPQAVAQVLELPAEPKKEEPLHVVPRPLTGIEVVTRAMNHRNLHQAKG